MYGSSDAQDLSRSPLQSLFRIKEEGCGKRILQPGQLPFQGITLSGLLIHTFTFSQALSWQQASGTWSAGPSLPCKTLLISDFTSATSAQLIIGSLSFIIRLSPQVVLKDLEVLAEIASSPAGQTDDPGTPDGPDFRVSHSELRVPSSSRANLLNPPSKYFPEGSVLRKC